MSDSDVTLVGNLTRDPELRFTNTGRAVAGMGIAVNRRWQNKTTQEWEDEVSFFNVTCWGQLGENVAGSLHKGDRVFVKGRLQQRSYVPEGKSESEKVNVVDVIADELGPSMRWATCEITKNERSGNGGSRPGPATPPGEHFGNDEEPF